MPIDPYSPCPGGTGKKIKFCCPDLVTELEKIQRMLEGEQRAACLEHIESHRSQVSGSGLPAVDQGHAAGPARAGREGRGHAGRFRRKISGQSRGAWPRRPCLLADEGGRVTAIESSARCAGEVHRADSRRRSTTRSAWSPSRLIGRKSFDRRPGAPGAANRHGRAQGPAAAALLMRIEQLALGAAAGQARHAAVAGAGRRAVEEQL